MAKIRNFFSRFQLVRQRGKNSTKIMLILAIVLSMGALITLRLSMNTLNSRTEALHSKAAALEQKNEELEEDISQLGSIQSVVEIAEKELDLVQPGTVLFQSE